MVEFCVDGIGDFAIGGEAAGADDFYCGVKSAEGLYGGGSWRQCSQGPFWPQEGMFRTGW